MAVTMRPKLRGFGKEMISVKNMNLIVTLKQEGNVDVIPIPYGLWYDMNNLRTARELVRNVYDETTGLLLEYGKDWRFLDKDEDSALFPVDGHGWAIFKGESSIAWGIKILTGSTYPKGHKFSFDIKQEVIDFSPTTYAGRMMSGDTDNISDDICYIPDNNRSYTDRKHWANTLFTDEIPENFRVILFRDSPRPLGYKGDATNLVSMGGHNLRPYKIMPAGVNKIQLEEAYFGDFSMEAVQRVCRKKNYRWAIALQDTLSGAITLLSKTWMSKYSHFSGDTTDNQLDWRLRPM